MKLKLDLSVVPEEEWGKSFPLTSEQWYLQIKNRIPVELNEHAHICFVAANYELYCRTFNTARERTSAAALLEKLLLAAKSASEHVSELRDAWSRGCISEHDGKGGLRSNRNADVDLALHRAIAAITTDQASALREIRLEEAEWWYENWDGYGEIHGCSERLDELGYKGER